MCIRDRRLMTQKRIHVVDARILVMGLTFKENCPDLRNTRVVDIVDGFKSLHAQVDVHDPWVDADEAWAEYRIRTTGEPREGAYDAIILAVPHRQFIEWGAERIRQFGKPEHVLCDVKYLFAKEATDTRL